MVLTLALYASGALVVVGAGLYVVGAYNQTVSSAREVDRAFANVEVTLKQRHDEIPRLVELCRGYMVHERSVLESVAELRAQLDSASGVDGKVVAENGLQALVSRLFVLAEDYPELKADALFLRIQERLTALEDEIADRRELFNASVTAYNTFIDRFPALVLAKLCRWRERPMLELGVTG